MSFGSEPPNKLSPTLEALSKKIAYSIEVPANKLMYDKEELPEEVDVPQYGLNPDP